MEAKEVTDLSYLIRVKEKELHEIHDLRCNQLERLVEERDKLLVESLKRFDQLKDDFEYNIGLLEARDFEIARLEKDLAIGNDKLRSLESELSSSAIKMGMLKAKEEQLSKYVNDTKSRNKQRLVELKSEIERIGWAAQEESAAKFRMVDSLKEQLKQSQQNHNMAMESQRRDLMSTYEALMRRKDEGFSRKEHEIAGQISVLQERLERLRTDNNSLKSEVSERDRRVEELLQHLSKCEDQARAFEWRLEDEQQRRRSELESVQRETQQLNIQLKEANEKIAAMREESSKQVDKANKDFQFQLEHVLSLEQSLGESKLRVITLQQEVEKSRGEFSEKEEAYKREIALIQKALEAANEKRLTDAKACDAVKVEMAHRLVAAEESTQAAKLHADLLLKEIDEVKMDALRYADEAKAATIRWNEDRTALLNDSEESNSRFASQIAALKDLLAEAAKERQQREERDAELVEVKACAAQVVHQLGALKEQLARREAELDEERTEAAAMRLRLQLHETQALATHEQTEGMQRQIYQLRGQNRLGSISDAGGEMDNVRYPLNISASFPASPMFSEDFGSVSLPTSPVPSPGATMHQGRNGSTLQGEGSLQQRHIAQSDAGSAASAIKPSLPLFGLKLDDSSSLRLENERLKDTIRDMRAHMEVLSQDSRGPTPMLVHFPSASPTLPPPLLPMERGVEFEDRREELHREFGEHSERRMLQLELRLQQATAEIARLRSERRKLMEVGNELRAALRHESGAAHISESVVSQRISWQRDVGEDNVLSRVVTVSSPAALATVAPQVPIANSPAARASLVDKVQTRIPAADASAAEAAAAAHPKDRAHTQGPAAWEQGLNVRGMGGGGAAPLQGQGRRKTSVGGNATISRRKVMNYAVPLSGDCQS